MAYSACENRYDDMPYRRVGQSGLKLPAVSLGMWQALGGNAPLENTRAVLRKAFDLGVTHIDLANNYGPPPGSAEEAFGIVLRKDFKPYRDEMIISTKAGYTMWPGPYGDFGSKKYLTASLDQSLARIGLAYVDIFYSHRFDPDTPLEETMDALACAVRAGKALYVGISNYSPEDTRRAVGILKDMGVRCLIHQPAYSMLNRKPEEGLLQAIEECEIGAIVFSPLAQGLLTGRYLNGIPVGSRASGNARLHETLTPAMLQKLNRLNNLAAARGQTLAQMALGWVLRKPCIASALIGASRPEQVEENVAAAMNLNFSAEELASIEAVLAE